MKNLIVTTVCLIAVSACNMEGKNNQMGSLSLQLTDGAVTNATEVYLTISGVTVKGPDGMTTFNITDDDGEPATQQIELLALSGSNAESIIDGWELTAGHYEWIRLHSVTDGTKDTYVLLNDSSEHELTIPSSDLKLVSGFTIPANGSANFTIDIDLSKALVYHNESYKLKPVMRLVDNNDIGHIQGTVDVNLFTNNGCTDIAVYAFAGSDTPADDIFNDEGPELIAWVDTAEGLNSYELGFLNAGEYTLYLVCDPVDDPEADDSLSFISDQSKNVSVEDNQTKPVDFLL